LFGKLAAFNERIAELTTQGHQGLAMIVLQTQALGLAAQIDELRCIFDLTETLVSRRHVQAIIVSIDQYAESALD
jgi:hypothetical protein